MTNTGLAALTKALETLSADYLPYQDFTYLIETLNDDVLYVKLDDDGAWYSKDEEHWEELTSFKQFKQLYGTI